MRFWIIILIVVLALAGTYQWLKKAYDKIAFDISFKGVDLHGAKITDLLTGSVSQIDLLLGAKISNTNSFAIPFKDVRIELFYEGVRVAETTGGFTSQEFKIPANGYLEISDSVNVIISTKAAQLIYKGISKLSPELVYKASFTVFGIPIRISDKFVW